MNLFGVTETYNFTPPFSTDDLLQMQGRGMRGSMADIFGATGNTYMFWAPGDLYCLLTMQVQTVAKSERRQLLGNAAFESTVLCEAGERHLVPRLHVQLFLDMAKYVLSCWQCRRLGLGFQLACSDLQLSVGSKVHVAPCDVCSQRACDSCDVPSSPDEGILPIDATPVIEVLVRELDRLNRQGRRVTATMLTDCSISSARGLLVQALGPYQQLGPRPKDDIHAVVLYCALLGLFEFYTTAPSYHTYVLCPLEVLWSYLCPMLCCAYCLSCGLTVVQCIH